MLLFCYVCMPGGSLFSTHVAISHYVFKPAPIFTHLGFFASIMFVTWQRMFLKRCYTI